MCAPIPTAACNQPTGLRKGGYGWQNSEQPTVRTSTPFCNQPTGLKRDRRHRQILLTLWPKGRSPLHRCRESVDASVGKHHRCKPAQSPGIPGEDA